VSYARRLALATALLAALPAAVPAQTAAVLRFPAGTEEGTRTLRAPLSDLATHLGGAVLYSLERRWGHIAGEGSQEWSTPPNPLLHPAAVPAEEALDFLEGLCALDGFRLRTLRAGSLTFLVVERPGYDRRLLSVDAAELPAWRGRYGEQIETTLPFRSGPGFLFGRAVQRIAEEVSGAKVEALGPLGDRGFSLTGNGDLVAELALLLEELQREPGEPATCPPPDFFPEASGDLHLPADGEPWTLAELLAHVSFLTGQHFACAEPERHWLEKTAVEREGRTLVPREEVWAFAERALRREHLALAEVRRREPRLMVVGHLAGTLVDEVLWARARLVPVEALEGLEGHPALLVRTVLRTESQEAGAAAREALEERCSSFPEPVRLSAVDSLRGAWLVVTGTVPEVREARRQYEAEVVLWKAEHGD